jgi:heptosyltransferase I
MDALPHPDLNGKRLLLIKPSALGDVCHGVATAWALKQRWPFLHLTWLVNAQFESLIKPISCVDDTIPFERSRIRGIAAPLTGRAPLRSLIRTLREGRFDVALDMQGLFRSGLFARLSGAPYRFGERGAREGAWLFYNRRVDTPAHPVHARERYAALAAALGANGEAREDLDVTDAEHTEARAMLREAGHEGGPLVAVCPGARWETKVYPAAHFARVLDELAERKGVTQPVLTGSPDMSGLCADILAGCKVARPVDLCGKTTLRQLAALLDLADLLLTCDSGPMHMAAAQGTPVAAVLGPTDPRRTGPWGQLENVISGSCELLPCLKRRCPGLGQKCLRDLDPGVVAERALALLS